MLLLDVTPEQTARACDAESAEAAGIVCRNVFSWTENETLARAASWLTERPLKVVIILVAAMVCSRIGRALVRRFTSRMRAQSTRQAELDARGEKRRRMTPTMLQATRSQDPLRAAARAETIGSVLKNVVSIVVWTIAGMLVLGELGINLAPLLASAGIAGVALGFGAQTLVRDFLAGIFMLVEDQFGVGDFIDVGEGIIAEVEAVNLRTTEVRDLSGTLWHFPNGEIRRVGNMSQTWAQAVVEVDVSHDTDLDRAMEVMMEVADKMWEDDVWKTNLMAKAEMSGVTRIGLDGVTIRLLVKTQPSMQWAVAREFNRRIKERFDREGIIIPALNRGYLRPDTNPDP